MKQKELFQEQVNIIKINLLINNNIKIIYKKLTARYLWQAMAKREE